MHGHCMGLLDEQTLALSQQTIKHMLGPWSPKAVLHFMSSLFTQMIAVDNNNPSKVYILTIMLLCSKLIVSCIASWYMYTSTQIAIQQQGQSRKVTIYNSTQGMDDPNKVLVTMDFFHKVKADGTTIIGKMGNPIQKHSVETFANQNFVFSGPTVTTISDLDVDMILFSTAIYQAGTLNIDMYIMKEKGTITMQGGEKFNVCKNNVKFNVKLVNWNWCNPCAKGANAISAFIDVGVSIKGCNSQASSQGEDQYDLGGGVDLIMSSKIQAGQQVMDMPVGYPKMLTIDGEQVFVFHFPKVGSETNYIYDPVIGTKAKRCGRIFGCILSK